MLENNWVFWLCVCLAPISLIMFIRLLAMPVFWAIVVIFGLAGFAYFNHTEAIRIADIARVKAADEARQQDRVVVLYQRARPWHKVLGNAPFKGSPEHISGANLVVKIDDFISSGGDINKFTKSDLDTLETALNDLDAEKKAQTLEQSQRNYIVDRWEAQTQIDALTEPHYKIGR